MDARWSSMSVEQALVELKSLRAGLSQEEARTRLLSYGPNALPAKKPPSLLVRFLGQFKSPLIYLLFAAAAALFVLDETQEAFIILAVLLFNAVVGVIQEGRAQNTLAALKSFAETNATVVRDGSEYLVADREVVPGDLILLQEGEHVPADARLIEVSSLRVDESALTGESFPVEKGTTALAQELPVSEQKNMAFKGTLVTGGYGRAVVAATGSATFIGGIAQEISEVDAEMPLKEDIRKLSRRIIVVVAVVAATVFVLGLAHGDSARDMFAVVVSLAVSVIPEGLPIVLTLVLASGVWRMSKRGVLVKKLQAVEALGQAHVLAVDKTGTLTKNELVIRKAWVEGETFVISGSGYAPSGEVRPESGAATPRALDALALLASAGARLSSARLSYVENERVWRVSGDPTEASLITLGTKLGYKKDELLAHAPLIAEIPFDYHLKYHATVHALSDGNLLTVAGAPEAVLEHCAHQGYPHATRLSSRDTLKLEDVLARWSGEGLRVLALAVRKFDGGELSLEEVKNLSFVGFLGIEDALRSEAAQAIRDTEAAGIRVVMITGDYPATARAIAKEAGLYHDGDRILTGKEIDSMTDPELAERLEGVSVFARVTPEHKARIIGAYRSRKEIVAMTGDGVNDAPSLVAADLGVAMGKIGTEVAKEAADIVLLNDNFGDIVSAVEEGRSIYRTLKKVILYLFSTSAGEVLTIAAALLLGMPLPLLAVQIIWLNFVTDGFLDVSLAMEPKEKHLLHEGRRNDGQLLDGLMVRRIVLMALPMAVGSLALFSWYLAHDSAKALTISLTVLAAFQWFNAWNCRSNKISAFQTGLFSNPFLALAIATVVALQLLAVYAPPLQALLQTVPLSAFDWALAVAVGSTILIPEEIRKYIARLAERRASPAPSIS